MCLKFASLAIKVKLIRTTGSLRIHAYNSCILGPTLLIDQHGSAVTCITLALIKSTLSTVLQLWIVTKLWPWQRVFLLRTHNDDYHTALAYAEELCSIAALWVWLQLYIQKALFQVISRPFHHGYTLLRCFILHGPILHKNSLICVLYESPATLKYCISHVYDSAMTLTINFL